VTVNLSLALQQLGARVGLVDADILVPSIPGILGIPTGELPTMTHQGKLIPAERHGLKVVSMVGKYLKMFVGGVEWGALDYLILVLPPGTGGGQGYTSYQVTLRQGLEVMLKRVAPEIDEIVDTTNHAAGKQPFYPRHDSGVDL
jgi:Mrp family chromosome partitioning ATPase